MLDMLVSAVVMMTLFPWVVVLMQRATCRQVSCIQRMQQHELRQYRSHEMIDCPHPIKSIIAVHYRDLT
jgi:hypothetical protein